MRHLGPSAPALADLRPMLLTERKTLPASHDWTYELKFDGYRILASTGPHARLLTKNGADATAWFPEVVASLATLPVGNVLDGEVCVLDALGRSDFDRLHARARRRRYFVGADLVTYCVFDQLVNGAVDIRHAAIERRRRHLSQFMRRKPDHTLLVTAIDDGAWLYQQAVALSLEGVVGKRNGSAYVGGRSADWFKLKRPGAVAPGRFSRQP